MWISRLCWRDDGEWRRILATRWRDEDQIRNVCRNEHRHYVLRCCVELRFVLHGSEILATWKSEEMIYKSRGPGPPASNRSCNLVYISVMSLIIVLDCVPTNFAEPNKYCKSKISKLLPTRSCHIEYEYTSAWDVFSSPRPRVFGLAVESNSCGGSCG